MIDELNTWLKEIYANQDWIIATNVLAGAAKSAKELQRLGATRALCIGASPGTGPLPDPNFAPAPIVFDSQGDDMMNSIRNAMELLANLPEDALAQVDKFDPERKAWVMGEIFDDGRPVAGRGSMGRPDSWQGPQKQNHHRRDMGHGRCAALRVQDRGT